MRQKEEKAQCSRSKVLDNQELQAPFQGSFNLPSVWPAYNGPWATRKTRLALTRIGSWFYRRNLSSGEPPTMQFSRSAMRVPYTTNRFSHEHVRHAKGNLLPIPEGRGFRLRGTRRMP